MTSSYILPVSLLSRLNALEMSNQSEEATGTGATWEMAKPAALNLSRGKGNYLGGAPSDYAARTHQCEISSRFYRIFNNKVLKF